MDLLQAPRRGGADLLRLLDDVVERLQMVSEGAPGQVAVAGDVDQGAVGVPPPQLLPQAEAVPVRVLQLHVQKVNPALFVFRRGQQLLCAGRAAQDLHIVVFHEDFPLQGGLNLVADGVLVVAKVNSDHSPPPTVSSCTNTPPSQLVQGDAPGQPSRMR